MTALEPDRNQLEIFVEATFRRCALDGFVSLRAFYDDEATKPFRITPISLKGGLGYLIDAAEDDARRAAGAVKGVVFCPPLTTFKDAKHAKETDILQAPMLSVELDRHPGAARAQLEQVLGPATMVVASGGQWVNGSGQPEPKLHLHWRLTKPAEGDQLAKLKRARARATRLAGGDGTNIPACHPIRWPGSWHRKSEPHLCRIVHADYDREIDLDATIVALEAVAEAFPPEPKPKNTGTASDGGDWANLVGDLLAGKSLHKSIAELGMKLLRTGMADGAAVRLLRALTVASQAPRDGRWQARYDDIGRAVKTAREKLGNQHQPAAGDIYSADALRTEGFPVLKQIAGNIIVEGATLLAARPKIGKTWLALEVAIAVDGSTTSYCLGNIQCQPGAVLFLALEDNKRRMQRRLTKLLGVNKQRWPGISIAHAWPRADQGGLETIRAWIAEHKDARLVIVDVLARFRKLMPPGKQNNYEADYEAIAALQKIASETGIAILVIHHTRKGEADDPLDAVSGTLGLAGAADAVLVIDRKADGMRLYGRSRDVDEIDKALRFDGETCRWIILGETADVQRSKERQTILDALGSEPNALKDIAALVGKPVKNVFKHLEKMVQQGQVVKSGRGLYARAREASRGGNGGNGERVERWFQR